MSPLLQSEARRPIWWVRLLDLRFLAGCLLVGALIVSDFNPQLFAEPNSSSSKSTQQNFPLWEDVEGALKDFFKREPDYQNGDLVTREQAEQFLKLLPALGWSLKDEDEEALLKKMLPEENFITQEFHTKAGMKFMRKISEYPLGYDRVHRLVGLKGGKDRLKELIRDPGGYKMIEYMAKSDGGKNLGLQLGDVQGGKDFNSATGFAYTAEAFSGRLHELHAKAEAERKEKSSRN